MRRFEERHRELREALKAVPAHVAFPSTAFQEMLGFEHRTSSLVDDLVAAVRASGHDEWCGAVLVDGPCSCEMRLVAALDEAADG